jgi:hypothetical protein
MARTLSVFILLLSTFCASFTVRADETETERCNKILQSYMAALVQTNYTRNVKSYFTPLAQEFGKRVKKFEEYSAVQVRYTNSRGLDYLKLLLANLTPQESYDLMSIFRADPAATVNDIIDHINKNSAVSGNFILSEDITQLDNSNKVGNALGGAVVGGAIFDAPVLGAAIGYSSTKGKREVVGHSRVAVTSLDYPNEIAGGNPLRAMIQDDKKVAEEFKFTVDEIATAIKRVPATPQDRMTALKALYLKFQDSKKDEFMLGVLTAHDINLRQSTKPAPLEELKASLSDPAALAEKMKDDEPLRKGFALMSEIDPARAMTLLSSAIDLGLALKEQAAAREVRRVREAKTNRTILTAAVVTIALGAAGWFGYDSYQDSIARQTNQAWHAYHAMPYSPTAAEIESFDSKWKDYIGTYRDLKSRRSSGHTL